MSNNEVEIWNKMDDNEKGISGKRKFDHSQYFDDLWNETDEDEVSVKAGKDEDVADYFKRVKKELLERSKDE